MVMWSKSKLEEEFQYGGRLFFQNGNSYISAVDRAMLTKFGLLRDTDLLKTAALPNFNDLGDELLQGQLYTENSKFWTIFVN